METIIIILGAILIIAGLLGSFLPVLPGPPISYAGILLLQLTSTPPFSVQFLIVWALIVIAIMILDNVVPAWGTRKYGGSPYGVWGSIVGLIAGFFFPPMGIIIGPIAGAFLGEMIGGKTSDQAMRAAWGSFVGFLAGTLMKVVASGMMAYYFFMNI
jgi:uncharacterized protein YqgC (DUF456 family)